MYNINNKLCDLDSLSMPSFFICVLQLDYVSILMMTHHVVMIFTGLKITKYKDIIIILYKYQ